MAEIDLQIFSLNCNGLNDDVKRNAVFSKLKRSAAGIYLLQETHSTLKIEQRWQHEWGNKAMYFSHGTSNSRGVAIIITNNYDANIVNIRRDTEGRILIVDLERRGTIYTIGNLYAPTRNFEREQQNVFNEFTTHLNCMKNEHTILGGDFNLYMDPRLDKLDNRPEHHDNRNYREDIISYLEVNNLVDAWRTVNPDRKFFTWHRGNKRSRLDYFFCSDHLLNFIENVNILPGVLSDHSLLKLTLKSGNDQIKGRGFWKFNSSLLHDSIYVNNIKGVIDNSKSIHCNLVDKGALWELVKLEIRIFTIPYCVQRKKAKSSLWKGVK